MIMYRRLLAWVPTQEEQCERFVIGGNQVPRVVLHGVKKGVLSPLSEAEIQAAKK